MNGKKVFIHVISVKADKSAETIYKITRALAKVVLIWFIIRRYCISYSGQSVQDCFKKCDCRIDYYKV